MNDVNYTRAGIAVALSLLLAACAGLPYAPVKYSNGLMTGANGMRELPWNFCCALEVGSLLRAALHLRGLRCT